MQTTSARWVVVSAADGHVPGATGGHVPAARPQFGEYATPEEQNRRAGRDEVAVAPAAVVTDATAQSVAVEASAPAEPAVRRRPIDRMVTIVFLAYGLVTVVMSAISYLDLATVMNESMALLGIDGEFTNYAEGRTWGIIAGVVLIVGWVATAALTLSRLRAGKLSWWVPVAGAIVFNLLAGICLTVPMIGDPAFVEYMSGMTGV